MLPQVFSRPLRWCAAGLCLAGTGLAGTSAVPAFAAVALASAVLAADRCASGAPDTAGQRARSAESAKYVWPEPGSIRQIYSTQATAVASACRMRARAVQARAARNGRPDAA
jgi:hypothetical protein